jgi:hypothetical protein
MRGWHISGSCDFEAYVVSVWNICTLDADEFRDFVFELYDADESGYLDREEALELVVDITTEAFAGTERSALLLQDLVTVIADSSEEAISKEDFQEFTSCRPAFLGPGYQLRQRMRAKFGGEAFWDLIAARRKVQGGVAAIDEVKRGVLLQRVCRGDGVVRSTHARLLRPRRRARSRRPLCP